MKVGDLVTLDAGYNVEELTGIVVKVDKNQKVGEQAFPYFVSWSTGHTDWMREGFLRVINAAK